MAEPWDLLTAAQRRGLDDAFATLGRDEADVVAREHLEEYYRGGERLEAELIAATFSDGLRVEVDLDGRWEIARVGARRG